jgi:hypothetical protein
MKNVSRHVGTLEVLHRLPSSAHGNPRYAVAVNGVSCRTPVDSPLGYKVTNLEGQHVEATIGRHYGVATLNSLRKSVK